MKLQLPTDHPRPAVQSFCCSSHSFSLPKELCERLRRAAEQEHSNLFDATVACFASLLRRYSAQDEFVIGTVSAGNQDGYASSEARETIRRSGRCWHAAVRDRANETSSKGISGQDSIFNVMFSFTPAASSSESAKAGTSNCDLELHIQKGLQGIAGHIMYSAELFEPATIERVAGHFLTMLDAMVANPDEPVSALPMLTAKEKQQFEEWNRTGVEYPRELCVHELVEAQVLRTPNASAVEHSGKRLTYRELNERANQLARFLRKRGVGHESVSGFACGVLWSCR